MPHFYFDIDDGLYVHVDEDGVILPDAQAARDEALDILPHITRESLPVGHERTYSSSVRDESGKVIYRATLSLVAEWTGEESNGIQSEGRPLTHDALLDDNK